MLAQIEYRNVKPLGDGRFDCEINHPEHGWISFTADPKDVEPHGRTICAAITATLKRPARRSTP